MSIKYQNTSSLNEFISPSAVAPSNVPSDIISHIDTFIKNEGLPSQPITVVCWDVDGTLTLLEDSICKAWNNQELFAQTGLSQQALEPLFDEDTWQKLIKERSLYTHLLRNLTLVDSLVRNPQLIREFIQRTTSQGVKHLVISEEAVSHTQNVLCTLLGKKQWKSLITHVSQQKRHIDQNRAQAILSRLAVVAYPQLMPLFKTAQSYRVSQENQRVFNQFLVNIGKKLLALGLIKLHAIDDCTKNRQVIKTLGHGTVTHEITANSKNDAQLSQVFARIAPLETKEKNQETTEACV